MVRDGYIERTAEGDFMVVKATNLEGDHRDGIYGKDNEGNYVRVKLPDGQSFEGPPGPKGDKGDTGEQGPQGEQGVSVIGATSDDVNITFELSDGNTIVIPWPDRTSEA